MTDGLAGELAGEPAPVAIIAAPVVNDASCLQLVFE